MPSILIRLATVHEKDGLEALQLRASLENEGDRPHLLANPGISNLPLQQIIDGLVYVAERDDKILGFASLVVAESGCIELDGLFVEPGHWRRGIGRALAGHVISNCKLQGVDTLRVMANPHALAFYASMNFQVEKKVEMEFGAAFAMKLAIKRC